MTTDIEQGLDLWQAFAETQEAIFQAEGCIQRDDERLWQHYLHEWDNHEWYLVIVAIGELLIRHPEYFETFHVKWIKDAAETLERLGHGHPRVLDTRQYKHTAWGLSMTLREVWSAVRHRREQELTIFQRLWDIK